MKKYFAILLAIIGLSTIPIANIFAVIIAECGDSEDDGVCILFCGNDSEKHIPAHINKMYKEVKASLILKKSIEKNISHLYSIIIPGSEQANWKKLIHDIDKYGEWADYRWTSRDDILQIYYQDISPNNQAVYQNISEFVEVYKNELDSDKKFKYLFNSIQVTGNTVLMEIDRFDKDAGDQIKQKTQLKMIEKWFLSDGWVIKVSYSLRTFGDQETKAAWEGLKKGWEDRFFQVQFLDAAN